MADANTTLASNRIYAARGILNMVYHSGLLDTLEAGRVHASLTAVETLLDQAAAALDPADDPEMVA